MGEFRSNIIFNTSGSSLQRSLLKSMGYSDCEMDGSKPFIGIVNTWNRLVPGHYNLDKVASMVEKGIYAAGGTPAPFGPSLPVTAWHRDTMACTTFCPPVRSSATLLRLWRRPISWTVW